MRPGLFITFEGGEGVGKSTQMSLLVRRLTDEGFAVQATREPGATELGLSLRALLMEGQGSLDPKAELLLYLADRAQHAAQVLRPWLDRKQIVLCDRFLDSSEVYQGRARGLGQAQVRQLHQWILDEACWPDLTLFLDLPPQEGLWRVSRRQDKMGKSPDRLEAEDLSFHQAVYEGFRLQAQTEPRRIRPVSALGSPEEVAERVWLAVQPALRAWSDPSWSAA